MKEELTYRIKDRVFWGKNLLLIEGDQVKENQLNSFQWEIVIDGQVKKIVNGGFHISALMKQLHSKDTILESRFDLSFLTRIKFSKNKVYLRRLIHNSGLLDAMEIKEEPEKKGFFIDEKISTDY